MNYYSDIGIIGMGFVGSAVYNHFKGAAWSSKTGGSFEKVDLKKYVFLCLPTPFDRARGFDISAIYENLDHLSPGKNIIIKSTVLPGTTKMLAEKYPNQKFFFNPEFLRAKTAKEDFLKPDRQIVGFVDKPHKRIAADILNMLPKADISYVCTSDEAEMVKLIGNCFLSTKVIFAEQMYDYCNSLGVDYDTVIRMVSDDPRIGQSHLKIGMDGHRGYAGACFPKDMGAVIFDSGSELLKTAHKLNDKYLNERI